MPSGRAERNIKFKKTMKKQYTKPSMEVIRLKREASLLVGSFNDPTPSNGGEFGYMPGDTTDMNNMT